MNVNPQISLTLRVADALTLAGNAYLITGSFASNFYGIPRSTKDADFVVQTGSALGAEFGDCLRAGRKGGCDSSITSS